MVAFDLLRLDDRDLTGRSFGDRYAALQGLFAEHGLVAPWSLCPATTDPEQASAWLADYPTVGIEGLVLRPVASRYVPGGRGWTKCKARHTEEALVGAVTGSLAAPTSALLGRFNAGGQLRYVGRTTTLHTTVRRAPGDRLRAAGAGHPWAGRSFTAGWGSRQQLAVHLVVPDTVIEVSADVARDGAVTVEISSPAASPVQIVHSTAVPAPRSPGQHQRPARWQSGMATRCSRTAGAARAAPARILRVRDRSV
ncbi:hypothetical protein ACIPSE_43425 [Streptomyces sp. NPDC090106]|uniref:ATP-dependent DNA ligase n=1 Tax=Streptomyces sp. NPDC090106 TaxID=3365946 RepID=UPI00382253E5